MSRTHILAGFGVAAAAVALVAAPALTPASAQPAASPPAKSHDQCFFRRDIYSFAAPNDHTVYIRVGIHDVYRLDLMTDCTGLSFDQRLALESQPNDDWVCDALGETVVVHDTGVPLRCPVQTITKLTPDEAAALHGRSRP